MSPDYAADITSVSNTASDVEHRRARAGVRDAYAGMQ